MKAYSKGLGKLIVVFLICAVILSVSSYLYFTKARVDKTTDSPGKISDLAFTPTSIPPESGVSEKPLITEPIRDSKIKSPLKIKGVIPPGWMFEGIFPILIKDSENSVLAQGLGYEVTPGSWQSGEPVEFQATISFPKRSGRGTIVLQNDNPSGLSENSKSFSISIIFE